MLPRWRDCRFSSARPGFGTGEGLFEHLQHGGVGGLDGDGEELDTEVPRELVGVAAAVIAGEAAGHGDASDVLGAEGVGGDGGDDA